MGFKFAWLCELLEDLDKNKHLQRATYSKHEDPSHRVVNSWYRTYNANISRSGPSAVAFLSCVFPERRPDRIYNLQRKRLTQILGRILGLGTSRLRLLESWQQDGSQDFPSCVERIMSDCGFEKPTESQQVTLEEIDVALTRIAANNIASAPSIRAQANVVAPIDVLAPIIRRLQSDQAKWLVRMILKSYSPVEIPEHATLYGFHFLLPKLLAMQNSFEAVVDMISRPELVKLPARPSREYENALLPILTKEIKPKLGFMIRRQPFDKARSIKHCVKIAGPRTMSVERKYDGEYCQIHIDNSRGQGIIQIFSKSGKDSTQDRIGLHSAIKEGLKLRTPECKIKNRAILEGELLIYSRSEKDILPFHHIRKHVLHGGRRIGTELDSPRESGEHLMIVFFDVLLLDDKFMLGEPHRVRRAHLKGMITPIDGEVQIVERVMIDFNSSRARELLVQSFSHAIRMRWEGFVLKGLEDLYFSWTQGVRGIKLKKDYIAGLGDSADLCIVGGHRDPKIETELKIGRLSWTTFYAACLTNKLEVQRFGTRPSFRIVDRLGPGSMSKDDILTLNAEGRLVESEYVADSEHMSIKHVRRDIPFPTSIYTKPMVVEIFGAGFERPQTADFYILRFPRRVGSRIKLHKDRDIADTADFNELQEMAKQSLREQEDFASQEEIEWMERLLAADPKSKYIPDKSQSTSPSKTQHSATTASLTPTGQKWANTQPSPVFVRADTGELTSTERGERYPDSAPQTPSRRSDSTASPTTTRIREVSKREFAVEDSPTPTARKRKRVAFEPTNRGLNLRTMSDMTEMVTRDDAHKHDNVDRIARTLMLPPEILKQPDKSKRDKESINSTQPQSNVDSPNTKAVSEASMTTTPSAIETQPPDTSEPSTSAATNPVRPSETSIIPTLTITEPIFLTSSLHYDQNKTISNAIHSAFTASNLTHTASPTTFTYDLLPAAQPSIPNATHARSIILIDANHADQGVQDIHAMIRTIHLPAPQHRPMLGHEIHRDVVVFDFRIILTAFWKEVLRRTRNEEQGEDQGYGEGSTEWKKYFCGTLKVGVSAVERDGEVGYNRFGEMFWE